MEDEGFDKPFGFIVTGQYLAIHYHGNNFEICRDYHARGALFYLSDDGETIIHNRTYVGALTDYPDYEGDVFYIRNGSRYLAQDGQWTDHTHDAIKVQIDPAGDYGDAEPPIPPSISNPVIDPRNPISADGVDLYHPDKWFSLYPITGDSIWSGDAGELETKLYFGGNPYSDGTCFQLSEHDGKTRIRSYEGKYLVVLMEPSIAAYLDEGCKGHTRFDRCSRCKLHYTIGYSSEPDGGLFLIPKGLPSMFVLNDGLFYYKVDVLKGSYSEVKRVEDIDDASFFQFVA
ncbi:uncharacterized protein N7518_004785 [Penicillium psychrosexuale]|uniref:uncharacterized protein n=1 Tax=Penicillium psychrosexuale TaxID=1002107 RepID=UPI002544FC44|nr:uncharacterized protein N7518_004785 [Penicillium psychrosexuale]KAJ5796245.1 hypothetical protein N7518_004785 [Penicillium psychrosexuale]